MGETIPKTATGNLNPNQYSGTPGKSVLNEDNDLGQMREWMRLSGEMQRQQRINAQCFLMQYMDTFKAWAPETYEYLTVIEGDPQVLKQKLTGNPDLATLMELTQKQIATLTPFVDIWLVKNDNPTNPAKQNVSLQSAEAKKVLFQNFYDEADITAIMTGDNASRTGACGLKEFYYEADGGGAGGQEVKRTRVAKLKFVAESLAALDAGRSKNFASVLDLAMTPLATISGTKERGRGDSQIPNPDNYVVRINYGWHIPKVAANMFNPTQTSQIKKSIGSMLLWQSDSPTITVDQEGAVEMELTYLATVEVSGNNKDKNVNVLAPRFHEKAGSTAHSADAGLAEQATADARAKLQATLVKLRDMVRNKDEVVDKGAPNTDPGMEAELQKYGMAGEGDLTESFDYDEVMTMIKGDHWDNINLNGSWADKNSQQRKMYDELEASYGAFKGKLGTSHAKTADSRLHKWSGIIVELGQEKKIHTLLVKKELLGVYFTTGQGLDGDSMKVIDTNKGTTHMGANTPRPNPPEIHPEFDNLEGKEKEKAQAAWKQYQAQLAAWNKGGDKIMNEKNNVQKGEPGSGANVAAHRNQIEDYQKAKADNRSAVYLANIQSGMEHSTGYLPIDPSGAKVQLHYIYLGDIISTVLKRAYATSLSGGKGDTGKFREWNSTSVLLGPMQFRDYFRTGNIKSMPLADIPIGMKLFTQWMMDAIIGPQLEAMDLKQFLTEIIKGLVVPALGGGPLGCFEGADIFSVGDGSGGVAFESFDAEGRQEGKGYIDILATKKRWHTSDSALNPVPKNSVDPRNHLPARYRYVLIHTAATTGNERRGDQKADAKAGIYHIGFMSDVGPQLETTFERVDDEELRTTIAMIAAKTNADIGIDGSISVPQSATVKMIGNNLFDVGGEFFVSLGSVGKKKEYDVALSLGFGGYYIVTKLHGTINENGWIQTMEGYPQPGNAMFAHRERFLAQRTGVFSGESANSRQTQEEAKHEALVNEKDDANGRNAATKEAAAGEKLPNGCFPSAPYSSGGSCTTVPPP